MKKWYQQYFKIIWAFGGLVSVVLLAHIWLKNIELDLTSSRRHTLSDGSIKILEQLPESATMKLYYSKTAAAKGSEQMRLFSNYFDYVKKILELFERKSQNKLKLTVIDPRPDTNEEEEAVMEGVKKFQLTDTETYIFGLVLQSENGNKKVIEFFNPQDELTLEYEIAKILSSLHQENKKRLGVLAGQDLVSNGQYYFIKGLEEFYSTASLAADTEKIQDVDMLLIWGGEGLSEKSFKAIDQFILDGGKILLLTDPLFLSQEAKGDHLSSWQKLFDTWGIKIPSSEFAGDIKYAGVARTSAFSPAQRLLPLFLCQQDCLKQSQDLAVKPLKQLQFLYPGLIKKDKEVEGLSWQPIIQTSSKGNSYRDSGFGLQQPQYLLQSFKEGSDPLTLAGKLVGKFPSAYGQKTTKQDASEASVILIADMDFLKNEMAFNRSFLGVSPSNDNLALVLNIFDQLAGSVELMKMRSRDSFRRSFTLVEKIQLEADQKMLGKINEINNQIANFQRELQGLAQKTNEGNVGLVQSEGVQRQKELQKQIARLKKELREAKREGRERVEQLSSWLYFFNVSFVPIILVLTYILRRSKFFPSKFKHEVKDYEEQHLSYQS